MDNSTTAVELDELYELREQIQQCEAGRKSEIDEAIAFCAPEIKEINERYDSQCGPIQSKIRKLDNHIKATVRSAISETVRGTFLMAVWSKPRVTWDSKGLLGYMVAHPEIEAFKRVGEPSVSIRRIK